MTNYELQKMLQLYQIDATILPDNMMSKVQAHLTKLFGPRRYILNYQGDGEPGSHWYALILSSGSPELHIYDSLGAPPDNVVQTWADKHGYNIITSDEPNQPYEGSLCGLWAIWALCHSMYDDLRDIYNLTIGMTLEQKEALMLTDLIEQAKYHL